MKRFFFFLVILFILGGLAIGALLNFSKSNGNRSGKLVSLAKVGVMLKTYEGTLDLGTGENPLWNFSVHQNKVGDDLIKQTGKMVRLDYKEHYHPLIFQSKNNVTSWELLVTGIDDPICRMVRFFLAHPEMVDTLRPEIQANDPELLQALRKCQSLIKVSSPSTGEER